MNALQHNLSRRLPTRGFWEPILCREMSFWLRGRIDVLQSQRPSSPREWTSDFTRKLEKGSLGGEVYASSKTVGPAALKREFRHLFANLSPGVIDLEDYESLLTRLRKKETDAEKYRVRLFLSYKKPMTTATWITSTGCRERRTQRAGSQGSKAVRRPYYACYRGSHSAPARFERCEQCPFKKMIASDTSSCLL